MKTITLAPRRAFTLIELMVVIALVGVIVLLAAPQMMDFIAYQRVKSINAQTASDLQFARSEAVSRNEYMGIYTDANPETGVMSCYTVFSSKDNPYPVDASGNALSRTGDCNCQRTPGSACTGTWREVRTVQMPSGVGLTYEMHRLQHLSVSFDPTTGGIVFPPADTRAVQGQSFCIGVKRPAGGRMRAGVNLAGRVEICSPHGSIAGAVACQDQNFRGVDVADRRNCLTEGF